MIDVLAIYSAFDIKISAKIKGILEKESLKDIPNIPIFGIFTTINRSQKINKWPHDIHGCLGYWTNNYSAMKPEEIVVKLEQLARDTNYKDERSKYFARDLSYDADASIEVSLMLLPLMDIDDGMIGDEMFDNSKYGLIVDSGDKRATYLPGVFDKIGWDNLKKSVMNKANLRNGRFYAYKTHVIKFEIYKKIFSELSLKILELDVCTFYKEKYNSFIPYAYNGNVIIDKEQAVRNVGSIGDVIKFSKMYDLGDKMKIIENNLDYYYKKYEENSEEYRQMSAFLIEDYYLMGKFEDRVKKMVNYLYNNIGRLEPKFELGEVMKVLSVVSPRRATLERVASLMYRRLVEMNGVLDEVFELNWQSQFIENAMIKNRVKHAEKIWQVLSVILKKKIDDLETNYWAVIYECLSNLVKVLKITEIKNRRLQFFIKLNERKGNYGLYYFKNMEEARLDITGHVILQP